MATRKTPIDLSESPLDAAAADSKAHGADDETTRDRMPSISTMIRYMSPEAIAERRRKARENFGRVTPVPSGTEKAAHGGPPAEDVPKPEGASGPSPWAQAARFEIDKAALPSAGMPARAASPSDPEPSQDRKVAPPRAGSRRHTWIIVALCAAVAVVGPILMVMAGRVRKPVEQGGGIATASARAVAPAMPSASASTVPTASAPAPTASATPSAEQSPDPSGLPTATAAPKAPTPASAAPKAPRRHPPQAAAQDGGTVQPPPVSSDFVQE